MGIFASKLSRSKDSKARSKSKTDDNAAAQVTDPLVRAYYQPQYGGQFSSNGSYYNSSSRGGKFGANGPHYQKDSPVPEPVGDYFSFDHHQVRPLGHHLTWAAEPTKPTPEPKKRKR